MKMYNKVDFISYYFIRKSKTFTFIIKKLKQS